MKKAISILTVFITLTAILAPVLALAEIPPQFNYLANDLKTLNVANRTTGTGWQDNSVSANANDGVAFQVYYHNGVVGTTANNTRVRLNFPTITQNTINVSVSLGADNASVVTDNVAINSSSAQKLVIDTASIKWYPNRSATPTIVPATASGIGYTELNIGNVQGGWEYQGYVTFTANLVSPTPTPTPTPNIFPRFNIFTPYTHTQQFNHDYFLLDVRNETKGTDYNFPVSADAGDVLVFDLYYHNGINSSTAINTTLKTILPSGASTQQIVTGFLWADNALNATPANPLSQNVTVNLSSAQNLSYVPGSLQWFPNQTSAAGSNSPLPNGQTAEQLFTSGINIGSINGCWEFSGQMIFKVKVSNLNAGLAIDKKMKNISNSDMAWSDSLVNVRPRQRLATQIVVTNTGTTAANNVNVSDVLPNRLLYVAGSTLVNSLFSADGITSGGIIIPLLAPGQSTTIYFETDVEREAQFIRGATNLVNTATARANNAPSVSDSMNISVFYDGCAPQEVAGMPAAR